MKSIFRKYLVLQLMMPVLFVWYIGGISLFPHSHVVNGKVIVHSHPYTHAHEHTGKEIETISCLSIFQAEENLTVVYIPEKISLLLLSFEIPSEIKKACKKHLSLVTLRGPPSLFS